MSWSFLALWASGTRSLAGCWIDVPSELLVSPVSEIMSVADWLSVWGPLDDTTSGSTSLSVSVPECDATIAAILLGLGGGECLGRWEGFLEAPSLRPLPPQPESVPRPCPRNLARLLGLCPPRSPVRSLLWDSSVRRLFRRLLSSTESCPRAMASSIFRFLSSTRAPVGHRFFRSAIQASKTSGESRTSVVPWIGIDFLCILS